MRVLLALCTALALPAAATVAGAETRIFIVENQRDGYGVDRCLANGADCGKPVASAYCQAREFGKAISFRKIDRGEITGGEASCRGAKCNEYVAIECTR